MPTPLEQSNQFGIKTITNELLYSGPKSFSNESENAKISIILDWLMPNEKFTEETKIQNITFLLNKMDFNGYLRIFEVEFEIIRNHLTDTSWNLLQDFKQKRQNDAWVCPSCMQFVGVMQQRWKCARCLYFYHTHCVQPNYIKGTNEIFDNFCSKCFLNIPSLTVAA